MTSEIHIFIVWDNASNFSKQIIKDLSSCVTIKQVLKVTWSTSLFSENLTRFYGQNLPPDCDKEKHIGNGPFHLIVVEDLNPNYEERETTKGKLSVNANIFDLKQKYRLMTGGGHKIHATNNSIEAKHDIWLLLGKDSTQYFKIKNWDGDIPEISADLIGANGWQSITELFDTLNFLVKYIVLRNFECLPHNYHMDAHGDIDILVEVVEEAIFIANAKRVFPDETRVHFYIQINNNFVPFDFRYVGDNYYDSNFQQEMLDYRELSNGGFFKPTNEHYFYSLLYHALIHKPSFSLDYSDRLKNIAFEFGLNFFGEESHGVRLLTSFFYHNDFLFVKPIDLSVHYREAVISNYYLPHLLPPTNILGVIEQATDITVLSTELRQHCTDWPSLYHLSGTRANILRPFSASLTGDVLEIGAGCGAITRYLGECGANVLALEGSPRRASIARSRTRDLGNVTVLAEKFDQFQCDHQFDVITLIGVLEYANLFTSGENPTLTMLERVRALLKPEGKLIIAIENQLGLKYFAGAPEAHFGEAMIGIEGRYHKDQSQTFGRKVLENMLEQAGFSTSEFLAPFPDYKLPISIVTEEGFANENFDASAFACQSVRRDPQLPTYCNFSLELAWSEVFKNELGLDLANSFLIMASPNAKELVDSGVLTYHYSTERIKAYCKETLFTCNDGKDVRVEYQRLGVLNENADKENNPLIKFICPDTDKYVLGSPLSQEFINIVMSHDWTFEQVGRCILRYLSIVEAFAKSIDMSADVTSPYAKLPGDFFDVIPQNIIIRDDGNAFLIDKEWQLSSPVEVGHLIFRSLVSLINSIAKFKPHTSKLNMTRYEFIDNTLSAVGLSLKEADYSRYVALEADIQHRVTGRSAESFLNWGKSHFLPIFSLDPALVQNQVASLNQMLAERESQAASLVAELEEQRAKFLVSSSWRLTRPLRVVRRCIASPVQQIRRYTKGILQIGKKGYQSLPLSYQTKAKHRQFLAKISPRLLLALGSHSGSFSALNIPTLSVSESPVYEAADLVLPTSDSPLVTIIIPIYGQISYTLRCLTSIMNNLPQAAFELIVVDDCSPDDSFDVLSKVKGIRLLRNEQNQGFIRSCNAGASEAKGAYLYFLNNDTEVTRGWLDELLRTFSEFPGTGLAGSKLVYPDGRLQEAGGIIWQDGNAWNYGRLQDPLLPVYNYAREVDFCSGASIMVPKILFNELEGFDEHYLPAYCEDADLALKIRDQGYRVIYQPMSTVFHYEGITSGTDTSQGVKAYQIVNLQKLYERWESRLKTHQLSGVDVEQAKDRRASRRVLVLDHCTPTPDHDAGSILTFNLMLLLREMDFQVTFIPEDNFLYMEGYTNALQRVGVEVLYAPYVTSVEQHLKEYGERYALALLIRPVVAERNIEAIRRYCPQAMVLFHTVDLHFLRMSREAIHKSDKGMQKKTTEMKQRELAAISAADATIVVSTTEFEIIRSEVPSAKLHVFPLILDVVGSNKSFFERKDIVFVGGCDHAPNVDAVLYFVAEIMPLLRQRLPGVHFNVVGSKPTPEMLALESHDVHIVGFVEDLTLVLDKMRVSVAPLRYGAGIKGKIASAMAVGLPVVATSLAAEGMSLTDSDNILVADGAELISVAVVKLYNDEVLWNKISHNGLEFSENSWGSEAAWNHLNDILVDISIHTERGAYPLSLLSSSAGIEKKINNEVSKLI